jgi:hypothetical protein
MNIGVARLLEEGPYDLGAFDHVSSTPRLQQRHDVVEVVLRAEVEGRVALVESASSRASTGSTTHASPFEPKIRQEVGGEVHGTQ